MKYIDKPVHDMFLTDDTPNQVVVVCNPIGMWGPMDSPLADHIKTFFPQFIDLCSIACEDEFQGLGDAFLCTVRHSALCVAFCTVKSRCSVDFTAVAAAFKSIALKALKENYSYVIRIPVGFGSSSPEDYKDIEAIAKEAFAAPNFTIEFWNLED